MKRQCFKNDRAASVDGIRARFYVKKQSLGLSCLGQIRPRGRKREFYRGNAHKQLFLLKLVFLRIGQIHLTDLTASFVFRCCRHIIMAAPLLSQQLLDESSAKDSTFYRTFFAATAIARLSTICSNSNSGSMQGVWIARRRTLLRQFQEPFGTGLWPHSREKWSLRHALKRATG